MKIDFNIVNLAVEQLHSKAIDLATKGASQEEVEKLLDISVSLYECCGYSEKEFLDLKFKELLN